MFYFPDFIVCTQCAPGVWLSAFNFSKSISLPLLSTKAWLQNEKSPLQTRFLCSTYNLVQDIQAGVNLRRSLKAETPITNLHVFRWHTYGNIKLNNKFQNDEINLVIKNYLIIQGRGRRYLVRCQRNSESPTGNKCSNQLTH